MELGVEGYLFDVRSNYVRFHATGAGRDSGSSLVFSPFGYFSMSGPTSI